MSSAPPWPAGDTAVALPLARPDRVYLLSGYEGKPGPGPFAQPSERPEVEEECRQFGDHEARDLVIRRRHKQPEAEVGAISRCQKRQSFAPEATINLKILAVGGDDDVRAVQLREP